MDIISTKGVAAALGVSEATVKRWADAGMLRCFRTRGGHRKFRMRDVKAFLEDETPPQMMPAASMALTPPPAPPDGTVPDMRADPDEARALALAGDVDGLVTLVANAHLRGIPLAWVFDKVIAPAMHEIGEGRVRGTVSVAQEHMATNAISETIARVRPLVESRQRPDRGRALCACIGEEKHDLAARMVALILIEQGYRTAMVGASIPSGDLARMLASERPSLVAIAASAQAKPEMLRGDLAILASAAAASRTRVSVVGGGFARLPSLPGAVRRHDSLADLMADVPPPQPPQASKASSGDGGGAAEQKAAG